MPSATSHDRLEDEAAANLVKDRDRDRFWSTLFAPVEARSGLIALYAFDAELARIPDVVSEPMLGHIRLQWWRDAIDLASPDRRTGNPIADAFTRTLLRYNLPKETILQIVDARILDVHREPAADMAALDDYLRNTSSTVFEMAAVILGGFHAKTLHAIEAAGFAFGLTNLLRTFPQQASHGGLLLPVSFLESKGVDTSTIMRGENTESLTSALAELREQVNGSLMEFEAQVRALDKRVWPAFLPLAVVRSYLKAMATPAYNPLQESPRVNPLSRFWRIWRAAQRGRI